MLKVSKYGIFPGSYFPIFLLNAGKQGPEKTTYLDTFYAADFQYSARASFFNTLKKTFRLISRYRHFLNICIEINVDNGKALDGHDGWL